MPIRYVFKEGPSPLFIKNREQADPQAIGAAIARIKETNGGVFRAEDGVQAARSNRHPLHRHLEWNDEVAGHQHRLHQMQALARVICIVDDDEEPVPAFINITPTDGRSRGYYDPVDIEASPDLQLSLVNAAIRDLEAFRRRYATLIDLNESVRDLADRLARESASRRPRGGGAGAGAGATT